ncbi:MAG TPA: glycoside hydrolase family 15 protein [Xanthobacteraceae bacterium]|nr:glycoside hydrolase family 15 protein [Xanthobacteraceae bacterium]
MASRIEDYALIGDCETAALIGRDGSLDWLCWPRFDSDACFAALLGDEKNGRWRIAPKGEILETRREYRKNTLILETTFETETGVATLIDFMPKRGPNSDIVRMVVGRRGQVSMCFEMIMRFGYGAIVPWVTRLDDGTLRIIAGPDMVTLRSPIVTHGENLTTVANFTVREGETIPFVLTYAPSHEPLPQAVNADRALESTEQFWTEWAARCRPLGKWHDRILRSLITLKALSYHPTGGIVAAPTTSLPEKIGGVRNWDYRYCWLRDATLTLLALMDAGYFEEAHAWRDWLSRAVAGSPSQLQIMYGIGGERRLTEWEVDWLPGYENSGPVRIGNAAYGQLQLDVYGEVMDAFHHARRGGVAPKDSGWEIQKEILAHLETAWRRPDEGIWEVRSEPRHFVYSKAMAWAAFDRAIKSAEQFGLEGPVARWKALREEIHRDVCRNGIDPQTGGFVQSYGSKELDASLLLLPVIGFLPPEDPRIRATVEQIETRLMVDGFLLRYDSQRAPDGLPPEEGAFLACSFWLVDAYVLLGRRDDAERLFERLLGLCNDVGLLSEEYDWIEGRLVGNFPQAFSHVGLINSAFNLDRVLQPAKQRSEQRFGNGTVHPEEAEAAQP